MTEVVNFKCNPILIGSLLAQLGILPAYHLNKGSAYSQYNTAAPDAKFCIRGCFIIVPML